MHAATTTNNTALLEKAALTLPGAVTRATERLATQHRFAADIVTCHRIGMDREAHVIDYTLMFTTEDGDVEHSADVEMTIGADGTPVGVFATAHDGTGACFIDGAMKEFGVDITVNEAAAITADIIINLLRDYAATK